MPLRPSDLVPSSRPDRGVRWWGGVAIAATVGALLGGIVGAGGPAQLTVLRGPPPQPAGDRGPSPDAVAAAVRMLTSRLDGLNGPDVHKRRRARADLESALLSRPVERLALAVVLGRTSGPLARRYLARLSADEDTHVRLEARRALVKRTRGARD